MGDVNGHNPLWGSTTTTDKGIKVEDFLSQEGLCIFNDGTDTYNSLLICVEINITMQNVISNEDC
jgi:hypothetical protein